MDVDAPSTTDQVIRDQVAPEQPVISEVVSAKPTCPVNTSLPDPAVLPEAASQENVSEPASVRSSSIPVDTSAEGDVVSGLKNSLLMAFQFESRLRELSYQAEVIKTNTHVSTYVSFLT